MLVPWASTWPFDGTSETKAKAKAKAKAKPEAKAKAKDEDIEETQAEWQEAKILNSE